MKQLLLAAALLAGTTFFSGVHAQDEYQFTTIKELKITPVKDQYRTGTCWSFSGVGFLEAELLRMGKGEHDLSEMFIVSHSYKDKADKFVRLHGYLNFAQGGSFGDVLYAFKQYGIVPEEVMPGLEYGEDKHVHGELEAVGLAYVNAVVENRNGQLSTAWKKGFDAMVDSYLGAVPENLPIEEKSIPRNHLQQSWD